MTAAFGPDRFDRDFAIVQLVEVGTGAIVKVLAGEDGGRHSPDAAGGLAEETERRVDGEKLRLAMRQTGLAAMQGNLGIRGAGDHHEGNRTRRLAGRFEIGWQASRKNGHPREGVFFVASEPQCHRSPSGYANEKDLATVDNSTGDKLRDQITDKDRIAARL